MDRTKGYFKPAETSSADERLAAQNAKLAAIVDHAAANSTAFAVKLARAGASAGDIRTVDDLARLPITEKAELVELQAADPPFGGFLARPVSELARVYCSPGPIYEPWPLEYEDDRWAEAFFAAGMRSGDTGLITFSFHMAPFGFMLDASMRLLGMRAVPTGVGNTELQIGIAKDLKAEAICATPSFLHAIAKRCAETGVDPQKDLNFQTAFVAAEMLPESLRDELETTFGLKVRQSYGTADVGCLGYECLAKNGMHFPEDCIVELVNPDTGQPVGPGELGEIVATNFDQTYPLIRFGTGDLSSYTEAACSCGRTAYRLEGIKGRVDQVTKVKGMFVHPGQVDQVAAKFEALAKWRVVVSRTEQQDLMTFEAELKSPLSDTAELEAGIKAAMIDILRLKGQVRFVAPGSIPDDAKKVDDIREWD